MYYKCTTTWLEILCSNTLPRPFLVHFPSFFVGCNDLTLDRNHFSKNLSFNIFYILVRIEERVFFQKHSCYPHFNITVQHLSPTTSLHVIRLYPITSVSESFWLPIPKNTSGTPPNNLYLYHIPCM